MTKKITIPPPDAATILAARHLDETEGPVQTGTVVRPVDRAAITLVLRYIARAHNAATVKPCGNCQGSGLDPRYNGEYACPDCVIPADPPVEICELPHETIEEEDECERQRLATPCGPAPDSCEPGGEPCARHEREESHADGEHELCGSECGAAVAEVDAPALPGTTEPVFIWVIDGEPDTGSLHVYAHAWARWRQGQGSRPSKTVLTWDDTSDPITWNVEVTPLTSWVDGRRPYRISVKGLPSEAHALVREPDLD